MPRHILAPFLLLTCLSAAAQDDIIRNSAGTVLGSRAQYIAECMEEMAGKEELASFPIDRLCSCMLDAALGLPEVDRAKSGSALDDLDFDKIIENDTVFTHNLEGCLMASVMNDMPLSALGPEGKQAFIDGCAGALKEHPAMRTEDLDPHQLCTCMVDEMYRNNMTLSQVQALQDVNSVGFNELMLPCAEKARKEAPAERQAGSPDVSGPDLTGQVPLVAMGSLHRVKMSVGGQERYYVVDSGAEDPIVTRAFADELLKAGVLTPTMRLEPRVYTIANGTEVHCERYLVQHVTIGSFTVANVTLAVLPDSEGFFLLGKSFLDKFTEWRIDQRTSTLFLKRG